MLDNFYHKLFVLINKILSIYENTDNDKDKILAKENVLILFDHIKSAKKTMNVLNLVYQNDTNFKKKLDTVRDYIGKECRNLTEIIYLRSDNNKKKKKKSKKNRKK